MKKISILLFLIIIVLTTNAQFGNSLSTDGVQDYIVVPDNNALDLTNNFTVECWIQAKVVDNLVLFRKGWCSGGDDSYYLSVRNGVVKWHWNESGNCDYPSSYETVDTVVHEGACTHISIVHSSTEVKIYVDNILVPGVLTIGNYSTINSSSEQLDIAAYKFFSGSYGINYWGTIDELRFWNYKLTQQEIINYSNTPLMGTESGLVAYFDMEDVGQGTSLTITNKATLSGSIIGQAYGSVTSPFFINSCIDSTEIEDNKINIYPNPTNGLLTIQTKINYQEIEITIFNILGEQVFTVRNLIDWKDAQDFSAGFKTVGNLYSETLSIKVDSLGDSLDDFTDFMLFFLSASMTQTEPQNGEMLGSKKSKLGYSIWSGIQFDSLFSDEGRWGVEYNYGSQYWRAMTYGEDTLAGSKIAVRGSAYEFYMTEPLVEKSLSMQLRFTYMDYKYMGSNGFFGDTTGTSYSMNAAIKSGFGSMAVDSALDARLYLRYKF